VQKRDHNRLIGFDGLRSIILPQVAPSVE
jgi:hypothetical protein